MTGLTPRNACLALVLATLVAGPALAQNSAAPETKAAAEAAKPDRAQASDARAYAVQTSEASRAGARSAETQAKPNKGRSNSRSAREVWRDRFHLPNAK